MSQKQTLNNLDQLFDRPEQRFINRELSWLAFNQRVLEESTRSDYPLLERVRFLSISASNLDEFLMVRYAGLKAQVHNQLSKTSDDGLTASQQLEVLEPAISELIHLQQQYWTRLQTQLAHENITIAEPKSWTKSQIRFLKNYFTTNIFPALSPITIQADHHFPFIPNLGIAAIASMKHHSQYGVVLLPQNLERLILLEEENTLVLLDDVLDYFKEQLFDSSSIDTMGIIRIIRDSELAIEDDASDLIRHFEAAVRKRRRGKVIFIESTFPEDSAIVHDIITKLSTDINKCQHVPYMVGLASINQLCKLHKPELLFTPYHERFPERINDYEGDYFAAIAAKDIVIHHPYETFDVVVNFLQTAARDEHVVSIKQTLYRTSNDSPIVKALIEAAQHGKSVTVVVELKARFDEESNIRWARDLEAAGAQVVFGFVDLKTHAKASLVIRKEGNNLVSYAHFGTGNYHPITARTYVDLSFFTCDPTLCSDAALLFNYLTGVGKKKSYSALITSPNDLKERLLTHIDQEINFAKKGKPANLWAKMNALVDPTIIDALYRASQAGVQIDLIVRGVCSLKPGIIGLSENIRVRSIIGRFLEHARIFCFGNGHRLPSNRAKLYISSADWMPRNFDSRVEVMVPITNATVHEQIMGQILVANLADSEQSWILNQECIYLRNNANTKFNTHRYFIDNPSLSGRGKALSKLELKRQRETMFKLIDTQKEQ